MAFNNGVVEVIVIDIGYPESFVWKMGVRVFNTTFNNISVISWRSVLWWRKPEYSNKITDPSQVTGKLNHNVA